MLVDTVNKHSERIASCYRVLLRDVLISKDKIADSDKKNNALDAPARQTHCKLLQSVAV